MSTPAPRRTKKNLETLRALRDETRRRVFSKQQKVPTFFDNYVMETTAKFADASFVRRGNDWFRSGVSRLLRLAGRMNGARFVDFLDRYYSDGDDSEQITEIEPFDFMMSQGVTGALQWKGMPLFKTVYDFALMPLLLWEVRPATILELGSGSGASAIWMADLLDSFGLRATIESLDIQPPPVSDARVSFRKADCERIEESLPAARLAALPHPWVMIEDAHVNTRRVIEHLDAASRPGDYLIIEDSLGKRADIAAFAEARPGRWAVDTRYCDYFGRNATCAFDSIFVRLE